MKSGLFFALTLFFVFVGVSTASAQTSCCSKSTAAAATKAETKECNSTVGNLPFLNFLPATATATAASSTKPANCQPSPACDVKKTATATAGKSSNCDPCPPSCCTKAQSSASAQKAEAPIPAGKARLL